MKAEQEVEVKLKSTVVDVDRVRDDEVKENMGLLEAAEQEDGKLKPDRSSFMFFIIDYVVAFCYVYTFYGRSKSLV